VIYEGMRLPASYANFYIGNAVVLMPVFGSAHDAAALATVRALFPSRRIVDIHASDLVWGLGACHCVTQQQPALV
jgi:agmatine deiminase